MENTDVKLEELDNVRLKLRKTAIILLFIFTIIAVIGFILCILNLFADIGDSTLLIVGFLMLLVGIIGDILSINKLNTKLIKKFSETFNRNYMKEIYGENYVCDSKRGLSYSYLSSSDVLNRPNEFSSNNYFSSTYKNIEIEGSDFIATFIHYTTDSKGHTHQVRNNYGGKCYVFNFPRKFDNYFCCFEKGSRCELYKSPSNRSKVEFESVDFNKNFESFSSDQTFAFYLMTPQVQLALLDFDKAVDSNIVFVVDENRLFVFMNNYHSKFKISVFTKIDKELLKNYLLELTLPLKLIDNFDVDKNKFLDSSLD